MWGRPTAFLIAASYPISGIMRLCQFRMDYVDPFINYYVKNEYFTRERCLEVARFHVRPLESNLLPMLVEIDFIFYSRLSCVNG